MTTEAVDTTPRVLTRRRLEQLRANGMFPGGGVTRRFSYVGPLAPLDRLLDENVPATPDLSAALRTWAVSDEDVDSPWGSVVVWVEPLWRVTDRLLGWKVWEDWGSPYDAGDLTNQHWANEDLARRYLEVLTDNFWAKVGR